MYSDIEWRRLLGIPLSQAESTVDAIARIKAEFIQRMLEADDDTHDDAMADLIEEMDDIDPFTALLMLWREREAFESRFALRNNRATGLSKVWARAADELQSVLDEPPSTETT